MTPLRASLLTAATLAGFTLLGVLLLGGTERLTREPIAAARAQAQRDALALVLPAERYDNDLIDDHIEVIAPHWLGNPAPMRVWRARIKGQPAALILEARAPDGYAGPIDLLIGVDAEGTVTGVRVVAHRETPGLGDAIEAQRSDWIHDFAGRALGRPPLLRWGVRRDGGDFDQFAGATITPRVVVRAVRRCLEYLVRHGEALYAAPVGATLEHKDGDQDRLP